MTIKKLISKLSKYDQDTEVCGGCTHNGGMEHYELIIKETHPIGDRDTEEELMILLGYDKEYEKPRERTRAELISINDLFGVDIFKVKSEDEIVNEIFDNIDFDPKCDVDPDSFKFGLTVACHKLLNDKQLQNDI